MANSHFLVIVPGYMGSLLRDKTTGELVWLDLPGMLTNPGSIDDTLEKLKYPNENIEPAGILERGVLYVLPWARLDHYGRLIEHLKRQGYNVDPAVPDPVKPSLYRFAYDWRQDNRISARQLHEAVKKWRQENGGTKAWIIGHSNGGIVARWMIEKEGGKEDVEKLFLMGSPWDGAPKALRVLFEGYEIVGRRLLNFFGLNKKLNEIIRSFPSYYQLIPWTNPFLRDLHNTDVNPFDKPAWLVGQKEREMLAEGLKFNQELGTTLSVPTVCYFGRQKQTTTTAIINRGPGGEWLDVRWQETEAGDGTVPERSAVHPQAVERHAFAVDHGSIYAHEQVFTQLDFELGLSPGGLQGVSLILDDLQIEFDDDDKDFYSPGEKISMTAKLKDLSQASAPMSGIKVESGLRWREALPGDSAVLPLSLPSIILAEDPAEPGTYRGSFDAPMQEGFYTLEAKIHLMPPAPLVVEEPLAVEKEAGE